MNIKPSPDDRAALSLSQQDYLHFSELMRERFGLAFPEKRRAELEIGVRHAFASSTCPDLDSYYKLLLDPAKGETEMERLVNHLTIGETYFFRDAGQFEALAGSVLPDLIEQRREVRTLRVWSAGCASGEEPYSIAMLLYDLLPDIENWSITVLGTDINTQLLERARRGMYGEWAFRETRARMLRQKYFTQHNNQYQLSPEIRRMVSFLQLNLAEDRYPSYENNTMFMDLILCRNVTIYFPEAITRAIVERFYNALSEGGWLVIGHSEHSLDIYRRFHAHNFQDAILYQRSSEPPSATAAPESNLRIPLLAPLLPPLPIEVPITFPPGSRETSSSNAALPSTPGSTPAPAAQTKSHSKIGSTNVGHKDQAPVAVTPDSNGFEQAQVLLNEGYVERGRAILEKWLASHPRHADGCALLGTAYANQGNWLEAKRWCQLAITHDRLNLEAYYTLGLVYQHQGERKHAIEMLKRVVYIDPHDLLGHFSLAGLYYSNGQTDQALKALKNTRRLLADCPVDEVVPRGGDITIGQLNQSLIELEQLWGKPSAPAQSGKGRPPAGGRSRKRRNGE